MSTPVQTNLDFNQNQLLHPVIHTTTPAPSSPVAGQAYYDTSLNQFGIWNGTSWVYLGSGGGTVTSVSVVSANGFAGTVATATSTPAITLTTSITGLLKGNGTAISAATAGTDYLTPTGSGASLTGITESQVTNLVTDLAAKAPLASPTFTGTPAAPTATAGTNTTQVATTAFVAASFAPLASPALTGTPTVPTATAGTNTTQAASTAFVTTAVQAAAQGLSIKNSCVAATVGTETYTITSGSVTTINGTTIDGQTPAINDRILVKDAPASTGGGSAGSTQPGNGIYVVTANTTNLTVSRSTDMSGTVNLPAGAFTFIEGGTANGNSGWVVSVPSTNAAFTYGTNNIKWTQFSGAGEITAGTGLTKSGNTLSLTTPVTIANGGTGQATAQAAINALVGGTVTAGTFLRGNGSNAVMAALANGDVATNTSSGTPASPGTNTKFGLIYNSGLTLGNGSSTSLTVTHNLNNSYPDVTVYNSSGQKVICDVSNSGANAIVLGFSVAPASNSISCAVVG